MNITNNWLWSYNINTHTYTHKERRTIFNTDIPENIYSNKKTTITRKKERKKGN